MDSLEREISSWKGICLSYQGRLTLINSVLENILIYFLSFFEAPKKVLKEIINIQRRFWWKGNIVKKGIY